MTHPEPRAGAGGEDGDESVPAPDGPAPDGETGTTVGTGSVLGIGCVVAVIVLVLVAFAVRWLTGGW